MKKEVLKFEQAVVDADLVKANFGKFIQTISCCVHYCDRGVKLHWLQSLEHQ